MFLAVRFSKHSEGSAAGLIEKLFISRHIAKSKRGMKIRLNTQKFSLQAQFLNWHQVKKVMFDRVTTTNSCSVGPKTSIK